MNLDDNKSADRDLIGSSNAFNFEFRSMNYTLTINLYNEYIELSLIEQISSNNYTSKQTIEDLLNYPIYRMFDNLEEIYYSMLDSINNKDFALIKDDRDYVLSMFSEYKKKLLKAEIRLNLICVYDIVYLTQKINTLSFDNDIKDEKIKELSLQNDILNDEIEQVKNEIQIIKTNYYDLKNELKETRNDFVEAIEKLQDLNKSFFIKQEDLMNKMENFYKYLNINDEK
jgi:gas vesicle protein